jgi:diguanylate cyclase (GGDEF)-like protein/PAS domain S-box-containing protein
VLNIAPFGHRARVFVGHGLLYAALSALVIFLTKWTGVRPPIWPADAVTVALLAASTRHDRLDRFVGIVGAITGWILLTLSFGQSLAFGLVVGAMRVTLLATSILIIDRVRIRTAGSRDADALFVIAASVLNVLVAPAAGLLPGLLAKLGGIDMHMPITLGVWWGAGVSALSIVLPPVLYAARPRPEWQRRPAWMTVPAFTVLTLAFAGTTALAVMTLPEPMLFVVVPLLLAAFFLLPPPDIAILSAVVWFASLMASTYGTRDAGMQQFPLPFGVCVGVLLPVGIAVLVERLRQRERDLAETESVFFRAMQHSSIGVHILGADRRYVEVNAAFAAMLGYTEAELIGRHFLDFTFEKDRAQMIALSEAAATGDIRTSQVERRYVRKNGEVFWARSSSIVVNDPVTGRPDRLITQVEDIDERKRAVEAIEQSESRWAFALENGQQGVWDIDKPTWNLYTSPTWKTMLGYHPDDIVVETGDAWLNLMHPDDRQGFLAINDAHERGETDHLEAEFRLRHKDGHWVWILDRGKVIARDAFGSPLRIIGTHTDISRSKQAEREIQLLEERVRLAVEAGGIGLWSIDLDSGAVEWNGQTFGTRALGREASMASLFEFIHPEDRDRVSAMFIEAAANAEARINTTCRLISPKRGVLHIRLLAEQVTLSNGDRLLLGTVWDMSEQVNAAQALRDEKERLRTTLHAIADGVISTDREGRVVFINPAAERMTGFTEADARGRPIEEVFQVVHEDSGHPAPNCVRQVLESSTAMARLGTQVIDVRGREAHYIREAAAPIVAGDDGLSGAVLVFQDVSAERTMQRSLAHAASHDDLTGLANRRHFEERIRRTIEAARSDGSRHGLLFIDLDRFKIVNDTAGHLAGDALLQEVARIMRSIVPLSDCLARLGGDEFAVLIESCDREFAAFVGEKLISAIGGIRFNWEGKIYEIGASAGVTQVDTATASAEAVLAEADVACYAAKSAGRGRVSVFRQETGEAHRHMTDFRMAARIRETIENGRFVLFAQHICPIADTAAAGPSVELLIRMLDENGEVSAPSTFIPAAERFELMGAIDRWVLSTVIVDYGAAIMAVPGLRVAVNLSANSLNDPTLWRYLTDLLRASQLSPSRLTIEITETAVINSFEVARDFIRAARGVGCHVSLDDFGSGLSSFTYLKSFDVDAIKIDGSFVHKMAASAYDRTVVRVINEIGRHLGVKVIAEGVEDEVTRQELLALGVGHGQGYLFDRPRDFSTVLADLKAEREVADPLRA